MPSFQTPHVFSMKHESLCNRHMLGKKLEVSYYKAELFLSYLFYFECLWFYYNHASEKHLRGQIERKQALFDSQLQLRSSRSILL